MNVRYFESEDFMGFEVKTAQDVTSCIQLGTDFINQDGDVINADFEDDDGEERVMTDTELTEDILKRIRKGEKVYAGTYMPREIRVFENCPTIVASNFEVGQKVFYMYDNKIWRGSIDNIYFDYCGECYKVTYKVSGKTYKKSEIFATKETINFSIAYTRRMSKHFESS